jgi:tetratricopeptide (TPR) repeat protein
MSRRLLPHAQAYWQSILGDREDIHNHKSTINDAANSERQDTFILLDAIERVGLLFRDQDKLDESEKIHRRALQWYESLLSVEKTSSLGIVGNLGNLYWRQCKLAEAEKMYKRALQANENALSTEHTFTLDTVHNLGHLYTVQGKLAEAEKICEQVL